MLPRNRHRMRKAALRSAFSLVNDVCSWPYAGNDMKITFKWSTIYVILQANCVNTPPQPKCVPYLRPSNRRTRQRLPSAVLDPSLEYSSVGVEHKRLIISSRLSSSPWTIPAVDGKCLVHEPRGPSEGAKTKPMERAFRSTVQTKLGDRRPKSAQNSRQLLPSTLCSVPYSCVSTIWTVSDSLIWKWGWNRKRVGCFGGRPLRWLRTSDTHCAVGRAVFPSVVCNEGNGATWAPRD